MYTFERRIDRKFVLIRHDRIGAQRWRIGRVRTDCFCRVCKHLIPAKTLAWLPDTTLGNARARICLLCVRQWEHPNGFIHHIDSVYEVVTTQRKIDSPDEALPLYSGLEPMIGGKARTEQ